VNIAQSQKTPLYYGVRSIPALLLFKNAKVRSTKIGALSKSQPVSFIDFNM
jgi:thioredoxin 1